MITENGVNFKSLEQNIFKKCCEIGREVMKATIEEYDKELTQKRDRNKYRHKGLRKTTIKTILGEIEYNRAIYEYRGENDEKSYIYLLDEAMGITGNGFMSSLLSEKIVQASCEGTYRNAAKTVSELTGQTISHTAAWNVVQNVGEQLDKAEQEAARLAETNKSSGTLETKLLFEEQDGIYLHLQGHDRKKHGKSYEMKLAIAYDGAKKAGKNRYELTNKVACANFENVHKFYRRKEGTIAAVYDTDEIEMRVLNGDGANWIKRSIDGDTVYQLDTFHRNRAIVNAAPDEDSKRLMFKLLYSGQTDDLLTYIDALANSVDDLPKETVLHELHTYFTNNLSGLTGYDRRGLDLPEPPKGKEYRRCGAMESNIFTIIGNRMKGRRKCWSIDGGNNMARLLCLKHTKRLSEAMRNLSGLCLPQKYSENIITVLSAANVAKSDGKGYDGFHQSIFPATPDFKWLRSFGALQELFEI